MSRNGPIGYPARAQARRPLPDEPYATPPTGQPQQPHWPPAQHSEPVAAHSQHPGWPPPAYQPPAQQAPALPFTPQPAYVQPTAYPPQPPAPQAGYGLPHASHAQPAPYGAAEPSYHFPHAGGPDPQASAGFPPQAAAHQLPFASTASEPVPGYPPLPSQAPTLARRLQPAEPQGYDLGSYMPAPTPGFPPSEPSAFEAHQNAGHHEPEPALLQQRPQDPYGYGESDDGDLQELLADEEEPPRRGRRGLMIAAALVGAIGLGGAMAYTYKSLVAPSGGRAPVIKAADFGPNKVKPDAPDGKGFAHTDKKLPNRLGEDGSAPPPVRPVAVAPAPEASEDPNAPRKVKIIPFTPGGQAPVVAAPPAAAPQPPPPPASNPPMVSVPGVMLEPMRTPQGAPSQSPPSAARAVLPPPSPPPQAQPPARATPAPPVKVVTPARAPAPPPAAEPAPPPRRTAAVASASAPIRNAEPKTTEPKTPVPKRTAAPGAPAASAGSGYVAVLSSQKSRMDALKVFANMREKYGDVLGSKTPDVQEADLGEKGVWYRAVVGPPGSREAASGVCSQLKTAGYSGCWVTAY